ncbi:MAG: polyribonucleotide nucleotidyltransferase [Candidatus Babeliaceae bacterium]|nr:polyribonucleotide nucleotidyltransferase [Candidatus Babeliaceae bacterium]
MEKKFSLPEFGYEVTFGKFAGQADGAAWLQQGGTIVLATVVSATASEFPGFLPLSVDYRELFAAAGKIPGGYFKREGKFSDNEVLTSRLIDRAIRPLFPENFFNTVQVMATVYSVDREHVPQPLALLATSLALMSSKVPFLGPVGVAEVALIDGKWVACPKFSEASSTTTKITVAGDLEGICMVEGTANHISESEFIDALFLAHDVIKKQVIWQQEIIKELNVEKESIIEQFDIAAWQKRAFDALTDDRVKRMFTSDKVQRGEAQKELKDYFFKTFEAEVALEKVSTVFLGYIFDKVLSKKITELCFTENKRIDSRAFDQVRQITSQVGLLPYVHGSALFTRGRTQALVTATLGSGQDEAKIDRLMGDTIESSFMLHYNFPPFSVGEARQQRGPGRREVGHGYLAASAIQQVLPAKDEFAYTIRIVADMLESDGSTSMATVCGSTLALMDAGVPIKSMVSGVAMGLLKSEKGEFRVLTDIAGIEDAFGLMDFKVAGTENGITAIQMDIKHKGGLERTVFQMALAAAHKGRLHIMNEMKKTISHPRSQLSALVPQMISFKIPTEKIGAVIGSGGKVIKEIIAKTGASIDIADDGLVKIFGKVGPGLDQAVSWVKVLGGQIERGMKFNGIVKRVAEFGLFVEIAPGLDGLVHVSTVPRQEQQEFAKKYSVGAQAHVEVLDYEPETGRIRLKVIQ